MTEERAYARVYPYGEEATAFYREEFGRWKPDPRRCLTQRRSLSWRVREEPEVAARMLEFTLLTAKRTSEARLMTFDEAALAIATGVWSFPADAWDA